MPPPACPRGDWQGHCPSPAKQEGMSKPIEALLSGLPSHISFLNHGQHPMRPPPLKQAWHTIVR